jgi:hypothetical protein
MPLSPFILGHLTGWRFSISTNQADLSSTRYPREKIVVIEKLSEVALP